MALGVAVERFASRRHSNGLDPLGARKSPTPCSEPARAVVSNWRLVEVGGPGSPASSRREEGCREASAGRALALPSTWQGAVSSSV